MTAAPHSVLGSQFWGSSPGETLVVLRACPTPGHLLGASSGHCVLMCVFIHVCMCSVLGQVCTCSVLGQVCTSPSLQDQCPMSISLGLSGAFVPSGNSPG